MIKRQFTIDVESRYGLNLDKMQIQHLNNCISFALGHCLEYMLNDELPESISWGIIENTEQETTK